MAVQEQTPLQEYTANGIAKQFDLEFDCESADHLIVSIDDLEVLHTDWYLSGNAIIFHVAPASGKQVKIQRNTPFNRIADYQSYNNSFRPPAINKDFDRIWWKLQELGVADWILSNRISALKAYVDDRDDELRAYLLEEIRKQGVALDQLDEYYNYLMERLAQIAVDKGWDASFVVDGDENQHQINNSLIRTVKTTNDLLLIPNPKNKQIIHVESIQKTFVYDENLTLPENGVTVIGKWEMQIQDAYYASWFALPGVGDVSEQIKVGYEYATSKKRTFIIDAEFNLKSNQLISGTTLDTCINVLSGSHLFFLPTGKINLITENKESSNIITAKDVDNYIITNPKLVGDRLTNASTTGTREWGYGLTIYPSSNSYIFEPDIKNCMGDGLYIGKNWGNNTNDIPKNITVVRPKIDRVRRNGIALTSGKNVFIDSPIVSNVTTIDGIAPTEPASGLDIEPESAPGYPIARLENCIIHNPTFINCDKSINFWNQPVGSFMDVRITGEANIYNDSTLHTGLWMRNERACALGSRLHIDKIVFNSKLDQPVLAFIYETSNVDVVIGEMVNNCNQNLDFVYAPVNGAQVFGRFKIGKLSTTNQNFGFTVVYSSLNTGCTTGLRIERGGSGNLNNTYK